MSLVIDCNQASQLPTVRSVAGRHSLALSPSVLAEILLRSNPLPTLERLRSYHIRFGLVIADVMLELSRLSLGEIASFEPFYNNRKSYQEDYEGLTEAIFKPAAIHRRWAEVTKQAHLTHCNALLTLTPLARTEVKHVVKDHRQKTKKNEPKPSSYSDLAPYEFGPDTFTGETLRNALLHYGCTPEQALQIHSAATANQYISRLFRSIHAYCFGAAGGWQEQKLNIAPVPDRDDITDFVLPLYAANGDIIVTADGKLSRLIALIEPEKRVKVKKASDI